MAPTSALIGRFIQVRATLKAGSTGETPILSDLRIQTAGLCSGTPPAGARVVTGPVPGNVIAGPGITFVKDATVAGSIVGQSGATLFICKSTVRGIDQRERPHRVHDVREHLGRSTQARRR